MKEKFCASSRHGRADSELRKADTNEASAFLKNVCVVT